MWLTLWFCMFLVIGGVAIDSSNAWRTRAVLQATADAAAHAAVIDLPSKAAAQTTALQYAQLNMDPESNGTVTASTDVQFGVWNDDGFSTSSTDGKVNAIKVTAHRAESAGNPVSTSFLRLIGYDSFDVEAVSIAERYFPKCMQGDGFFARRTVDLQSNNTFFPGLCIHGNYNVSVNNNNVWHDQITVSMPDLDDLSIPTSDIDTSNPGLKEALTSERLDPKIVDQIDDIIDGFINRDSPWMPTWISGGKPVIALKKNQFNADTLETGRIYDVDCENNQNLNIGNGSVISKVIIITDCRVQTGNSTVFTDVILASRAEDGGGANEYAFKIAASTQMGADDNCTPNGGVKVFSKGSVNGSSGSKYFGVEMVAKKTIIVAAQASGMEGVLFFAGEDISVTSNNAFRGECAGGVDPIIPPHYRIVL